MKKRPTTRWTLAEPKVTTMKQHRVNNNTTRNGEGGGRENGGVVSTADQSFPCDPSKLLLMNRTMGFRRCC